MVTCTCMYTYMYMYMYISISCTCNRGTAAARKEIHFVWKYTVSCSSTKLVLRLSAYRIMACTCTLYMCAAKPLQTLIHPSAPAVFMGSMAIIAGALGIFLPETRGKNMPDTVAEATKPRYHHVHVHVPVGHSSKRPHLCFNTHCR